MAPNTDVLVIKVYKTISKYGEIWNYINKFSSISYPIKWLYQKMHINVLFCILCYKSNIL